MAEQSPSSAPQGQTLFLSRQLFKTPFLLSFLRAILEQSCGDSGAGLIYPWLNSSVTLWRELYGDPRRVLAVARVWCLCR
jgi:hypothetical protein